MKKIINKTLFFIAFVLLFIGTIFINNKLVGADDVLYETPDTISISDLTGQKSLSLLENLRFTYDKKASHGSIVLTFDVEAPTWDSNNAFQIYFMYKDGSRSDYWWDNHNLIWFNETTTHVKSDTQSSGYYNIAPLTSGTHSVEIGRLAMIKNKAYTGEYLVYIKVDGVEIGSVVNNYDYKYFINEIMFTGNATKTTKLVDPNYIEPTYEEPDVISVSDLTLNGKPVNGKIVQTSGRDFKYNRTAKYGSLEFNFILKIPKWTVDGDGSQYHFYSTYQMNGAFWLRPDANRIIYEVNDNVQYITGDKIYAGMHNVTLRRLALMQGDTFTGNVKFELIVDDILYAEHIITNFDTDLLSQNDIYITGTSGNVMLDTEWTGNKVTFMANKEVYQEITTMEDYIEKPLVDPQVPGKDFIGWFDNLGNEWIFDRDMVAGDLVLTAAFRSNSSIDDEDYFSDENFTPVLRFSVSSDTHISSTGNNQARLAKELEVAYLYAQNSTKYNSLDAALFAGDVSDDGSPKALQNFKDTLYANLKGETVAVVSMGNHEYRTYDSPTHEKMTFEEIMGTPWDVHYVIKGYHFIALSPNVDEGYHFSEGKVKWLEEQLAIAQADDPNKPIFVQQHEGVTGTIYGSISWGMDELTDVLCKYPQVVDFSGHSHYPLSDPRSIWQGSFTALGTGTLHYYEMGINGYKDCAVFPTDKNGGWASSSSSVSTAAEFQIVELDANNAMRVIVYDLLNDREIRRYYMRDIMEDRKLTYSHTERAKNAEKPTWGDVTLKATTEENTLNLEFNQATCKDIVESYRIYLYQGDKLVQTEYALSDYFFYPMPSKIKVSIPYLDENTEYIIKVYAVNVWNQVSDEPIVATATTGELTIYEDKPDVITLRDLYSNNDGKVITTERMDSYKPVHFIKSEDNYYGSFIFRAQLLYTGGSFQVGFNEEFNNAELVWINESTNNIWFIEENYRSPEPVSIGLHTVEYGRLHKTEGANSYTVFYVKIDDDFYHEYKSTRQYTNNGYFIFNFGSTYLAGSRYYDIDQVIPRNTTPEFENGADIQITTPISNWYTLGGLITFDSLSSSLDLQLEDYSGPVSVVKNFEGSFKLGTNGDYYHYEIKTNQFDLASGAKGNEGIIKLAVKEPSWKCANVKTIAFEDEQLDSYDEISINDLNVFTDNGVLSDIELEKEYAFAGTSKTYSAVLKYYLICNDISLQTSEFRSQLGTLWSYYCTIWMQDGNPNDAFFGFQYKTRPTDRFPVNFESYHIYLVETGTIRVTKGEWAGWNYTYFKVDGELITGFYVSADECKPTTYGAAFKLVDGYQVADVSLARTIQYIVDGNVYKSEVAVSGAKAFEPKAPTKEGLYFTGWYTDPIGGERVNFDEKFVSNQSTVRYYAHFSNELKTVNFYNGDELIDTQNIGVGGQLIKPANPVKTGTYKYSFINWVIRGTNDAFDFNTPITEDLELEAYFEEYKYEIAYRVDGLVAFQRYYLESNPTEIIDGEPLVPSIPGSNGYWVYSVDTRTKGNIYAIARYNGANVEEGNTISLSKFNGKEVDIADDLTRLYLSFNDTLAQRDWLENYPAMGGHEKQNITFEWNDTANSSNYYVYFADNAEFNNAFIVKTSERKLTNVGIFVPGQTYYWKVVNEKTNQASSVDTFKILNATVRWISADTVYNMRDLGGWTTTDGKEITYGKLYRGGQLSLDNSGERSYMNDYSYKVFDYLGIKTEIELRGDNPHDLNQFNPFEKLIFVNGIGYVPQIFQASEEHKQFYRNAFAELAKPENYPFYFHCSWGADRTGTLAFFIEGVLGVPYEQLAEDYELTSLSYSGKRIRVGSGFEAMYVEIMNRYGDGTDFKTAMNNYLVEYMGVRQSDIDSLRNIMLTDASTPKATHTVTYRIDGEVYSVNNVYDGGSISCEAAVFFDRFFDQWLLNGEPFDPSTPVTTDLVLDAKYIQLELEDYDRITVRDLIGLGESYSPGIDPPFLYEGYAANNSRIFEFDYEITSPVGRLEDGVHMEFDPLMWTYKCHVWLANYETIHVFTNSNETPTLTTRFEFLYGHTYHVECGVVIPINGPHAGKKLLILLIDNELIFELECNANLMGGRSIGMAGLQGVLHSVPNLKAVTFKNDDGRLIDAFTVQRGALITPIKDPICDDTKVFVGWFDDLGNKWDFATSKVYKDIVLFARFGDRTITANVEDNNGIEIEKNYQVKLGAKVSEITTPLVSNPNLVFDGWYNGNTKLNADDVITEDMNLICRFNFVEPEPINPIDPVNPVTPTKGGCKSGSIFTGLFTMISLVGILVLIRKRSYK